MLALKIVGAVILIFFLIGRIRVGLDFQVIQGRITLSAKIFRFLLPLIPANKKKEKALKEPATENNRKTDQNREPAKRKPRRKKEPFFKIDIFDIKEMLSKLVRGIRIFRRGLNCDRLLIDFTASSWDPYITANMYSYVNAFLSAFAPLFEENNRCRDCFVRTRIDFNEPWPKLDFALRVSLRIGAVVGMIFSVLFGVLWVFIKIIFRFLKMRLFDKEEYDFRMNCQEGPIAFFRRVIREGKELRKQNASASGEGREKSCETDAADKEPAETDTADKKEENEERNSSDGE